MAQSKTTKTVTQEQRGIIGKLVGLLEGARNQRVAIGQRFYELLQSGMSRTAAITAVKAALPEAPEFYLGAKLTPSLVNSLVAIAHAVRDGGLIHGNHHVTEADINVFRLNTDQQAALMTAMKRGTEKDRVGVSIASVKAAANAMRRDPEKGQKLLDKVMERVVEVGGYKAFDAGSREALVIAEREALAAVERAEKALAKAQDRLNRARTALKAHRAADKTTQVEPAAVKPARTRRSGGGKGKTQPIAAAAA